MNGGSTEPFPALKYGLINVFYLIFFISVTATIDFKVLTFATVTGRPIWTAPIHHKINGYGHRDGINERALK